MPSKRTEREAEGALRVLVNDFKRKANAEPSAGNVAIYFAKAILSLINGLTDIGVERRKTILSLCEIAERVRPLPTLRWSKFVEQNLDSPSLIWTELDRCLDVKRGLDSQIRSIVRRAIGKIGISEGMRVYIDGYSVTLISAIAGLEPAFRRTLTFLTATNERPGGYR